MDYEQIRSLLRDQALPCAFVDLDGLEANLRTLLAARGRAGEGKTLRLASKSIRCTAVLRQVLERGGAAVRGLMTYSAAETAFLAREGFDDLLLAYPTLQPGELRQ